MEEIDIRLRRSLQSRRKELYGEWLAPTERELQLEALAKLYHERCEAYDRRVCSGISPHTGEAMPVDGRELGSVNNNAYHVLRDILSQGVNNGFSEQEIMHAIRHWRGE